ncbi:DUF5348 domain-containing protein [Lentibacillus sp. CBA3610]|uniref:DUF5348 domain-containing protein n=1 Tax=Lentibacillus sp. CBA3610 TaxID=2518176 RepID=UPI0015954C00|nr:DUF5348 domain-containing protein [Lentibacillus sp. CBA3610]QKY70417.1 hypothetical protein Len3610_13185 [Lentibacillus sp. CBA3610]
MRREGVMVFNEIERAWRIRIGDEFYETLPGMNLEIGIQHRYYEACFEIDYGDWFVTLEDDVDFSLRLVEEYKVLISEEEELIPAFDLPF